jgi:hypothetical protein
LIEFEEARSLVLECATPLEPEVVALSDALERVLAEDVSASGDVPPFDNSAMDGFAVRAADSGTGVRLRVVDESRAGAPAGATIAAGQACAISTGAAMPAGADAVVAVENTRRHGGEVELLVSVQPDRHVRHAGEDARAGELVLAPGVRIGPAQLGVLVSAGRTSVLAGRRPRVAVVTTGDELVGVDQPLAPGAVRNSGAYVIPALVQQAGGEAVSVSRKATGNCSRSSCATTRSTGSGRALARLALILGRSRDLRGLLTYLLDEGQPVAIALGGQPSDKRDQRRAGPVTCAVRRRPSQVEYRVDLGTAERGHPERAR